MHIDKKMMHRIFLLVAGSIVFGWLVLDTARATELFTRIWELIAPFVTGAAIAFIFNVPMRAIENQLEGIRKQGIRRGFSLILTIAALVLVITFVVELLVPQIRLTIDSLSQQIPAFVEKTAAKIVIFMDENPEMKAWVLESMNLQSIEWSDFLKQTLTLIGESVSSVMGSAFNVIGNVTGAVVNTVISVVFAIYCLCRKEILARQGRRILYAILPEKRTDEIIRVLRLTNVTFSNFISGQCLEALILGCLFAVVMALLKMPYIPLVSVIIAVTALIPVVGAFVGCLVGAFFILVNDPIQAVTFIAMFLVLQQLENNLIYPRVVGTSIGLPGMWVLVAVTVGGELMGVGGMLLMIPLASVGYTLAREFTDRRLAERNIPPEKLEDQPMEIKSRFQQNRERKENKAAVALQRALKKMQNQQKKEK
ncbi:MAG: AI-2E family transporter [Oscillospiraceae bacterium]|nr:AI-2E family transporter [Oscillospiraceae bacterium]